MTQETEQELLDELAERFGIAPDYYDIFGQRHVVTNETKRAILAAMGVQVETAEQVVRAVAAHRHGVWMQPCDPVLVRRAADLADATWSFRLPAGETEEQTVRINWTISDEMGRHRLGGRAGPGLHPTESHWVNGSRYVRFELPLPAGLGIGYYDLAATGQSPSARVQGTLRVVVTPACCYRPSVLQEGRRLWGLSLQLYALRSSKNWGCGDFGDLLEFTQWAAGLGAEIIGLNPLHALKNSHPFQISPYSPDSRLYVNPIYLDVERVPEWTDSAEARRLLADPQVRSRLEQLRQHETVQYEAVYDAKRMVLDALFDTFQKRHCRVRGKRLRPRTARGQAFEAYVREEGEPLETFALFQALAEMFHPAHPGQSVWQKWPEPYRNPHSPEVTAYRSANRVRIRFHQYLQWVVAEQMLAAAQQTKELGMSIGLYHDLALGSDRTGSDAWMFQDLLALNADCGAPPDAFALEGQNWGLPPVIPHRVRADGYRMFALLLRKNLQYGGATRLDHVMALFRLFWVPRGMPASAGTYVRYPWEDLLGILALESVRRRAVIIGEDLGTVPDFVREKLSDAGVLSYRVYYFERTSEGEWKAPGEYPHHALAVVSTHDLPTLAGYWTAQDLETRFKLGLFADEAAYRQALEERRGDKERMLRALRREGLLTDVFGKSWTESPDLPPALNHAVHAYLARTPSHLMLVNLEDLLNVRAQVNVPGTVDSYPNWSLKTPILLEELLVDPKPRRLAAVLQAVRPKQI